MAGSLAIQDFKSQIQDFSRPNRFWMSIVGGSVASNWQENNMAFLCKGGALPERTIGDININWQGMEAKFAGDPKFDDITFTFNNDYDWNIRNFFEAWFEEIATMETNDRTSHDVYQAEVILEQLGRTNGEILATYRLINAYPSRMDQLELNHDSTDSIQEFSVTFRFDLFERLS